MTDDPRHIGGPLMLGLIALPIVFVWFLFGQGYARSTRNAALLYAFAFPVLAVLASLVWWPAA